MKKIKTHTILISDIHLGSKMSQSNDLLLFLDNIEVENLVLNGDVFDDLRFNRLKHMDWEVFSQFRKMSDKCNILWVRGNHDFIHEKFMSCLLGVNVVKNFYWHIGKKRVLATHGDIWDIFIYKYKLISDVLTWIYNKFQEKNSELMRGFNKLLKEKSKMMIKNTEAVRNGAIKLAKENAINIVICGHTHIAELVEKDSIIYGNCGTWESAIPTYITIDENIIKLFQFENGKSILLKGILLK